MVLRREHEGVGRRALSPRAVLRDVLQLSGLLAGDVKELQNDSPTRFAGSSSRVAL